MRHHVVNTSSFTGFVFEKICRDIIPEKTSDYVSVFSPVPVDLSVNKISLKTYTTLVMENRAGQEGSPDDNH